MKFTRSLLLASLMLLLIGSPARAKGPAQLVVIEGVSLSAPIRVTDAQVLKSLSMAVFEDFMQPRAIQKQVGPGIMMTRYYIDDSGKEIPFDRLIYFEERKGNQAYSYYMGIVNGSSEYDGKWFVVTKEGHAAMQAVLAQTNAKPSSSAVAAPYPDLPTSSPTSLLAPIILAGLGGWLLGRRKHR